MFSSCIMETQRLDILLLGCKEVGCGQMQMLHTAIVPGSTDWPGPILLSISCIYIAALPSGGAIMCLPLSVKQPSFIHHTKLLRTSQHTSVVFIFPEIWAPFPCLFPPPTICSFSLHLFALTGSSLTKRLESSISHASFKVTSDREGRFGRLGEGSFPWEKSMEKPPPFFKVDLLGG